MTNDIDLDIIAELRDELPDGIPLDVQARAIDAVTGESEMALDESLEIVVRTVPEPFEESHVHPAPGELALHLTPRDAREFDAEVLNPLLVGVVLDRELSFTNDYDTRNP